MSQGTAVDATTGNPIAHLAKLGYLGGVAQGGAAVSRDDLLARKKEQLVQLVMEINELQQQGQNPLAADARPSQGIGDAVGGGVGGGVDYSRPRSNSQRMDATATTTAAASPGESYTVSGLTTKPGYDPAVSAGGIGRVGRDDQLVPPAACGQQPADPGEGSRDPATLGRAGRAAPTPEGARDAAGRPRGRIGRKDRDVGRPPFALTPIAPEHVR